MTYTKKQYNELKECNNDNKATWIFLLITVVIMGIIWISTGRIVYTKDYLPTVVTGAVYSFDFGDYRLNDKVYKLNTDGTTEEKTLMGISFGSEGVRYEVGKCAMGTHLEYDEILEREISIKGIECRDVEDVAMIGNTKEELFNQLCDKSGTD